MVADIAYHKRVQSNGFDPQHGGVMTSMYKVYTSLYMYNEFSYNRPMYSCECALCGQYDNA